MTRPEPLPSPVIRPLHEEDIDKVVLDAGGRRASPDSSREAELNPDFRLGNAVIELKLLNDEGLLKPERQAKIAELFSTSQTGRPVVVVDPRLLSKSAARDYAAIMEGPVRGAVAKGRAQLKHYRLGNDDALVTVLFVINNGFAALAHDELLEHVVRRAKNDTDQIDAVVVAGCYFHSDGFDTFALWPIDHIAIRPDRPFAEFEALKAGWDKLAGRHMTEFVRGEHGADAKKQPVADIVFDIAGITYVKPAPGLGNKSDFYGRHRPRLNDVNFDELDTVATTVPRLSRSEHRRFRDAMRHELLLSNEEAWSVHMEEAFATSQALRPVIPIDVTRSGWEAWRRHHPELQGLDSVRAYANDRFNRQAKKLILSAQEMSKNVIPPRRYIAVGTEIIGQDARNDVSHVASVLQRRNSPKEIRTLVADARLRHEHAVALAAAYAVLAGIDAVFWQKDLQFAWT